MLVSVASAIKNRLAETILRCSQAGGQSELIALAWSLRNRAQTVLGHGNDARPISEADAESLTRAMFTDVGLDTAEAAGRQNGHGRAAGATDSVAFQQAQACISLVFDGLVPDPTNGASRVHRHDQEPCWANACEATALIGPLMFLRECDTEGDRQASLSHQERSN